MISEILKHWPDILLAFYPVVSAWLILKLAMVYRWSFLFRWGLTFTRMHFPLKEKSELDLHGKKYSVAGGQDVLAFRIGPNKFRLARSERITNRTRVVWHRRLARFLRAKFAFFAEVEVTDSLLKLEAKVSAFWFFFLFSILLTFWQLASLATIPFWVKAVLLFFIGLFTTAELFQGRDHFYDAGESFARRLDNHARRMRSKI